ncbi:glycosyltransferase family 2 protein [Litoribacter populi]|uniref:glycosyltransferase family 2 protein n=1 Tax=Litoribacter populi TaxID=2598460 RepID=UPI00117DE919|nr:glycosyltransferase family 2 protein [Litoribacter populi]
MVTSKSILCIIISYNGEDYIEKCINSLYLSSINPDIICVDNNSFDSTVSKIKINFPNVKVFVNNQNQGFGQANNIGLSYTLENNYDFAFLLNQDAWVELDTIEKLVKNSLERPEFGILSPIHLNGRGDNIDFHFSNYVNEIRCKGLISDFILERPRKEVYELPFVNAAAWLITKTCIQQIGGFDPLFFHYGEDDNYCQRAIFHGFKIGIIPEVKIFHDRNQDYVYTYLFHDLKNFDRVVKPKLADINKDFYFEFRKQKRELDSFIFYSIIDLKIRRAIKLFKFRSHLMKMKKKIKRSIEINKKIGTNYLNESINFHSYSKL